MVPLRFALLLCGVANMLGSCAVLSPSAEVRYRITVEVNTPQGIRSGSGVWSFKLMPGTIDQGHTSRFRGEAIPVRLPNGTVYALLDLRGGGQAGQDEIPYEDVAGTLPEVVYSSHYLAPLDAAYPSEVGPSRYKQIEFLKRHMRGRTRLNCKIPDGLMISECPLLVTFRDPADPQSVEAVSPEDMSATLGRGYSLRGIYLQITNDRPTHQIGKLPWEDAVGGHHLDGSGANQPGSLPSRLSILSFKQW